PMATTYDAPDVFNVTRTLQASGAGSVLSLPSLTGLVGDNQAFGYVVVQALAGGRVDLGKAAQLTGPAGSSTNLRGIQVLADGAGSVIDLTAMTSFVENAPTPDSSLQARNGGTVLAGNLATLKGVKLTIDGTGTLATGQITSFTNGTLAVVGTTTDFHGLA